MTLWTIACPARLYMGFSRQQYCSGLPFPTPGELPDPRIESMSPAFAGRFFTSSVTQEGPFLMDKPFYFEDIMCAKDIMTSWHKDFIMTKWHKDFTQSCLTLSDPMDCNSLSSSIHGHSPCKNTGMPSFWEAPQPKD